MEDDLTPIKFSDLFCNSDNFLKYLLPFIKEYDDPYLYCTSGDIAQIMYNASMQGVIGKISIDDIISLSKAMVCAVAWRKNKQIYKFDHDLAKILSEQSIEGDLPVETLKNLPYKCIYIQTDIYKGEMGGFFVYFAYNQPNDVLQLVLYTMNGVDTPNESCLAIPINLTPNRTLKDCMLAALLAVPYEEVDLNRDSIELASESVSNVFEKVNTMIQMVLYLCAENKDVVEAKRLEFNKKNTNVKKKKKRSGQTEAKVQRWDVGTTISREFKQMVYTPKESAHGTGLGGCKAPHMRKAHWHHYWTGSKDNRKLIVKWVPPMYINKSIRKDPVPTINRVRQEKR